ncbi:MAG: hypothetical protein ABSB71_08585 [Candidatus Bathyarchaeia archaeon]
MQGPRCYRVVIDDCHSAHIEEAKLPAYFTQKHSETSTFTVSEPSQNAFVKKVHYRHKYIKTDL